MGSIARLRLVNFEMPNVKHPFFSILKHFAQMLAKDQKNVSSNLPTFANTFK